MTQIKDIYDKYPANTIEWLKNSPTTC